MDEYYVNLDQFEGPLDLLLHLVKEKEMDLLSIDLSEVTSQYLDYIHHYQHLNLEVASEYLVTASYLVELKSRMLLPREEVKINDEYEEDPREELIKRLMEYKKYKEVAEDLKKKREEREAYYIKPGSNMEEYTVDVSNAIPNDLDLYDLLKAMQKMYQRKALSAPLVTNVNQKEISIDDCLDDIRNRMKKFKKIAFEDLFEETDIHHYVVNFLAILVLCNKNEITIYQDDKFDTIYLEEVE